MKATITVQSQPTTVATVPQAKRLRQALVDIKVPCDRDSSFEPRLVPKRQKDVSEMEEKVLAMYARGMSQRDIAETIEDIYGFEISHEMISQITDCVLDELGDWQNRPLKKCIHFCLLTVCMSLSEKSMRAKIMLYIRF